MVYSLLVYTVSVFPVFMIIILYVLYIKFPRMVSKQNWHFNYPLVGMLPGLVAELHRFHEYTTERLEASGQCTVVFKGPWFLGMNYIFTCSPDNVNHIYALNFANYTKGEGFSEIFEAFGDSIFSSNSDSWRFQRKLAHSILSSSRSFIMESSSRKVEKVLLPLLNQISMDPERVVDLQEVLMRFTFDVTCMNEFGIDLGYLSLDFPRIPFPEAFHDIEEALLYRHVVPRAWWKFLRWYNLGVERKMARAVEIVDSFFDRVMAARVEDGSLLSAYIARMDEVLGEGMFPSSHKFLRDTLLTLMGAGSSTTGIALSWFFWAISLNPRVEARLLEELSPHARKYQSCMEVGPTFKMEDVEDNPYLHGALCETLRLFTPVPFNHKEAAEDDSLPSGHKVYKGCTMIVPMYCMGRMREVWGEDCLEFKPERWISEEGRVRIEPPYKFCAFASGPRSCLGKNMAMAQMKLVAASVVYSFRIRAVEGSVVVPRLSILLEMKNGLLVHLERRTDNL